MVDITKFRKRLQEFKNKRVFVRDRKRYIYVENATVNDIEKLKKENKRAVIVNANEYICKRLYKCDVIDSETDEVKKGIFDKGEGTLYVEL